MGAKMSIPLIAFIMVPIVVLLIAACYFEDVDVIRKYILTVIMLVLISGCTTVNNQLDTKNNCLLGRVIHKSS